MMFSLVQAPPHEPALWEGPGYVYDVFLRRKTEYVAHAQSVPGPLPALWEGPGYEASARGANMEVVTWSDHLNYSTREQDLYK